MAVCIKCGTQIPDGAGFCTNCGTQQGQQNVQQNMQAAPGPGAPQMAPPQMAPPQMAPPQMTPPQYAGQPPYGQPQSGGNDGGGKNKGIIIGLVAAIVVLLAVLVVIGVKLLGGDGGKDTVSKGTRDRAVTKEASTASEEASTKASDASTTATEATTESSGQGMSGNTGQSAENPVGPGQQDFSPVEGMWYAYQGSLQWDVGAINALEVTPDGTCIFYTEDGEAAKSGYLEPDQENVYYLYDEKGNPFSQGFNTLLCPEDDGTLMFVQGMGAILFVNDASLVKAESDTEDYFLGKWDCTNDMNSTLVISRADPQSGGYFLEFFFYRIAYTIGYANASGDGLSINYGESDNFVEGTARKASVKGELVRTPTGFDYTITESEHPYLSAGDVYSYVRGTDGYYELTGQLHGRWECADWTGAEIRLYTFFEDGTWSGEYADYEGTNNREPAHGTYQIIWADSRLAEFRLFDDNGNRLTDGTIMYMDADYGIQFDDSDAVYYRF